MLENRLRQHFTLIVRDEELLGKVSQDTDSIDAGIDYEVDAALLAGEIKRSILVECSRGNRENAAVPSLR